MTRPQRAAILLGTAASMLAACSSAGGDSSASARRFMIRPASCQPMSFPIYFRENSDALTDPAMQMISTSAEKARRCQVAAVTVIGLGDGKGGQSKELDLSKRRAASVAEALKSKGFPAPAYVDGVPEPTGAARGPANPSQQGAEVRVSFAS